MAARRQDWHRQGWRRQVRQDWSRSCPGSIPQSLNRVPKSERQGASRRFLRATIGFQRLELSERLWRWKPVGRRSWQILTAWSRSVFCWLGQCSASVQKHRITGSSRLQHTANKPPSKAIGFAWHSRPFAKTRIIGRARRPMLVIPSFAAQNFPSQTTVTILKHGGNEDSGCLSSAPY